MEISTIEFPVAKALELYDQIEAKRKEYLERIKGQGSAWDPSWNKTDLLARHDSDPEFRLRYYKFVLVSILAMACQKHAMQVKRGDTDLEDEVSARCIGVDLSHALSRNLDIETFNEACEVIMDYLTGVLDFGVSGKIPTQPPQPEAVS